MVSNKIKTNPGANVMSSPKKKSPKRAVKSYLTLAKINI